MMFKKKKVTDTTNVLESEFIDIRRKKECAKQDIRGSLMNRIHTVKENGEHHGWRWFEHHLMKDNFNMSKRILDLLVEENRKQEFKLRDLQSCIERDLDELKGIYEKEVFIISQLGETTVRQLVENNSM